MRRQMNILGYVLLAGLPCAPAFSTTVFDAFDLAPALQKTNVVVAAKKGRIVSRKTQATLPLPHSRREGFILQFKVTKQLAPHLSGRPNIFITDTTRRGATRIGFTYGAFYLQQPGKERAERKIEGIAYKDSALVSFEYVPRESLVRCLVRWLDGTVVAAHTFTDVPDLSIDSLQISVDKRAYNNQAYGGVVWYDPGKQALFMQDFKGMYRRKGNRWDRKIYQGFLDDLYYTNEGR